MRVHINEKWLVTTHEMLRRLQPEDMKTAQKTLKVFKTHMFTHHATDHLTAIGGADVLTHHSLLDDCLFT